LATSERHALLKKKKFVKWKGELCVAVVLLVKASQAVRETSHSWCFNVPRFEDDTHFVELTR